MTPSNFPGPKFEVMTPPSPVTFQSGPASSILPHTTMPSSYVPLHHEESKFQMSAGPLSLPKSLGYNPMPLFSVALTNTSIGMTTFGDFGPLRSDSLTTQCKMMPVWSESTPLAHMGLDLPADIVKVQKFAILKISPMKEGIKLEKKFSWWIFPAIFNVVYGDYFPTSRYRTSMNTCLLCHPYAVLFQWR